MDAAKKAFEKLLLERIDEAESKTGHTFSDLRDMIAELGGWQAAKRLVSPGTAGTFSYGFKLLASQGLLRCSVEQSVIDSDGNGLFDEADISNARARVTMANMIL